MGLEILSQFLSENSEITFEKPKNLVWTELVGRNFQWTCLFVLVYFESISYKPETIGRDQNFVLFLNMGLEMLCLFLFNSNEGLFERPDKFF
jgi:hypothetical protein